MEQDMSAAAATPAADAELIELCAEHDAIERELLVLAKVSTIEEENRLEAAAKALRAKQLHIADQIGAVPPASPAGWRALAGTIALMCPETIREEQNHQDGLLIATLLQGLLGPSMTGEPAALRD